MALALINVDRLRHTFSLRDVSKELYELGQCATIIELKERFPETYQTLFGTMFKYLERMNQNGRNDDIMERLSNSAEFYDGYRQTILLNDSDSEFPY